jgi:hypothetical protein
MHISLVNKLDLKNLMFDSGICWTVHIIGSCKIWQKSDILLISYKFSYEFIEVCSHRYTQNMGM